MFVNVRKAHLNWEFDEDVYVELRNDFTCGEGLNWEASSLALWNEKSHEVQTHWLPGWSRSAHSVSQSCDGCEGRRPR